MFPPVYWLHRPIIEQGRVEHPDFDQLYDASLAHPEQPIDYTLSSPKWLFLSYLAEQRGVVLHGSGNPNITRFEPRQPVDISAFGNQNAVYGADDGIWAMFFAIVDRDHYPMTVNNSCIRVKHPTHERAKWYYFFSMSKQALLQRPFRQGTVYLLPRDTFTAEPSMQFGELEIRSAQVASLMPVEPLARLSVSAEDFPFLAQIRGHDDARLAEYVHALQTGAPLPD